MERKENNFFDILSVEEMIIKLKQMGVSEKEIDLMIKRIEKNLSQEDLARLAEYSGKSAISKLEHAGDNITMKQVKRIAKALNVTSAYLMGWESPRNQEFIELIEDATPVVQESVVNLLKSAQPKS